ncbi:DUF4240 domain-containing protein [Streptomyces sp. NPDC097619]|uniref:DUF4240 domain-containing protein n=1 Tax=Streptomyces sp. NPDC097619 TaxID=3157228 RepID=UPI00331DAC0D
MNKEQFWNLIEEARAQEAPGASGGSVAGRASALLGVLPVPAIAAAQRTLWEVLAEAYRMPLWAAAHVINGGCSDDGFDHFRGWLMLQGREVFERAVADPDALAGLPEVRAAAPTGRELECGDTLGIVWRAYRARTGAELPGGSAPGFRPAADPGWDFDFGDRAELSRRLPALSALYGH